VTGAPFRYRSPDEDSGRWTSFEHRPGDIVISTRSKSGTTWLQMICALLVFQTPELPAPLAELSPWLDWLVVPMDHVDAQLAAQTHRRFIKTHTPLDGLPLHDDVTYLVGTRHPLDMAVSLYHHRANLDRAVLAELLGSGLPAESTTDRPPLHEWLVAWIDATPDPREELDSLPGVMWHLSDAWARRDQPNVVLVRFEDLSSDLDGEMRRLARLLDLEVADDLWLDLVRAAGFDAMRERSEELAPAPAGVIKDRRAFFRRGAPGAGRELLSTDELARYDTRAGELAPAELLAWLHA
jgi:hypothetical protein